MAMDKRKQSFQSLGWVRDMYSAGLLNLDPPYQRRSVWNQSFKQFFIDTILRNYPVPPIFVNMEVRDDGTIIYHVIDGKQRLLSVLEFMADEFSVSAESYSQPSLSSKYFSQLETTTRNRIIGYFLPFEIFTEITDEDVTEVFDRFNRNVQRLTAQELRHAKYGGQFISLMEQLADDSVWDDLKLFSRTDRRRMRDVEYVSVLSTLTMDGIQEGDNLDWYYAEYDVEFPGSGELLDNYNNIKSMVASFQQLILETRFRNRADFYSLWSVLLDLRDDQALIEYTQSTDRLREFAEKVDMVPKLEDPGEADDDAVAYSQTVRAGTTKQPNREKRKELLLSYIIRR